MTTASSKHPAPPIGGIYIHIGNGARFHTANSLAAHSTNCGINLEKRHHSIEPTGPYLYIEDICRRCAEHHLDLALALEIVHG